MIIHIKGQHLSFLQNIKNKFSTMRVYFVQLKLSRGKYDQREKTFYSLKMVFRNTMGVERND